MSRAPEPPAEPCTSAAAAQQTALFPLAGVLLPGGLLPLRIFEPRYVDLIGRCLRQDETFGVVLIRGGAQTESVVSVAGIGTSARIVDFQPLPDGLLGVLCRGERRFRILERHQQRDGLNCARIEWLAEPLPAPPAPEFAPLVAVLREAIASLPHSRRLIEPQYEDAGWVSHRLAELLPLEPQRQQRLLELDDPEERLRLLARLMQLRPQPPP